MPARSKAQSRYLNWRFGHAWVKRHHFDNATHNLPGHADPRRHLGKRKHRRRRS